MDLRFPGPIEAKSFVGAPKIDPPGAQEGSPILNVDLVVVTAAVAHLVVVTAAVSRRVAEPLRMAPPMQRRPTYKASGRKGPSGS
jgi:hypothetical protein